MKARRENRGVGVVVLLVCCCAEPALSQHAIRQAGQPLPVVQNDEGIRIDILPDATLLVGTKASFQISAKQAGYLVVVDVNAAGKINQIYPNANYVLTAGAGVSSNRVKAGQMITVPEEGNPYTGFVFVVSPPAGVAMSLAILSDQPVQFLDLPDVPASMAGTVGALKYLADATRALQVAPATAGARPVKPKWSVGA